MLRIWQMCQASVKRFAEGSFLMRAVTSNWNTYWLESNATSTTPASIWKARRLFNHRCGQNGLDSVSPKQGNFLRKLASAQSCQRDLEVTHGPLSSCLPVSEYFSVCLLKVCDRMNKTYLEISIPTIAWWEQVAAPYLGGQRKRSCVPRFAETDCISLSCFLAWVLLLIVVLLLCV